MLSVFAVPGRLRSAWLPGGSCSGAADTEMHGRARVLCAFGHCWVTNLTRLCLLQIMHAGILANAVSPVQVSCNRAGACYRPGSFCLLPARFMPVHAAILTPLFAPVLFAGRPRQTFPPSPTQAAARVQPQLLHPKQASSPAATMGTATPVEQQ